MPITPIFIATWKFGVPACNTGWPILNMGGSALDAVEAAGNVTEDNPEVNSVGYGGLPNSEGEVELDAAIMDGPTHAAGSVAGLTKTGRPISVARCVMERTPHVLIVGQNAVRFARDHGFPETNLLTEASRLRWQQWKQEQSNADVAHFDPTPTDETPANDLTPDNHDTIGLCALDRDGNLAAGCTTSGMAWKLPGRVGDSPIIGSGLYVDNAIGCAAATGHGDEMMKACLCYRVVILMEQGRTPEEACIGALRYLIAKRPPKQHKSYGAALIALRKDGAYGAAGTRSGFRSPDRLWQWAVAASPETHLHEGVYVLPDSITPSIS